MVTARTKQDSDATSVDSCNEVRLLGRVSVPPETRELPSGDVVVTFRVVVDRPDTGRRERAQRVDSIVCTAWRGDVRRTVTRWQPGDTVQVVGSLRCRFYRGAAGAVSRSEVEVLSARRVRTANVSRAGA